MVGFDTIGPGNKEKKKEYKKSVRRGKKSSRKEKKLLDKDFKKDQKIWEKEFKKDQKIWEKEEKKFAKALQKAGYDYGVLEKIREQRLEELRKQEEAREHLIYKDPI